MSVTLTFKDSNGSSISSVSHGDATVSLDTTAEEIYVSHNGTTQISAVRIYAIEKTGTYSGAATAEEDFAELLSWGDGLTEDTFGGIQFNFDAEGGYPTWPTYGVKSSTNWNTVRTGVGDSSSSGILLPIATGTSAGGVILAGSTNTVNPVRFAVRLAVPNVAMDLGIRQFDLAFKFSYLS